MELFQYRATVKHDSGSFNMMVIATSEESAVLMIMESEGCPRSAIAKIIKIEPSKTKKMIAYKSNLPEITLKYKKGDTVKHKITCSTDANILFRKFFDQDTFELTESMIVLFLNKQNNTIGWTKHSQGGITGCIMDVRLILGTALKAGATGIMVAHNHPSGNLHPSESDIRITRQLKEACQIMEISFLDHLIVSEEGYYSFADEGRL